MIKVFKQLLPMVGGKDFAKGILILPCGQQYHSHTQGQWLLIATCCFATMTCLKNAFDLTKSMMCHKESTIAMKLGSR